MMFSARLGEEATLLELAYELEEAVPFRCCSRSGADSDVQSADRHVIPVVTRTATKSVATRDTAP